MNKVQTLVVSGVVSLGLVAAVATPAFAWHPEGKIVKKVQNITAKGALSDANSESDAVAAAPGDVLTYVITVSNAQTSDDGKNDMVNTVMTDTLPDGLEFVSNAATRTINENLGTLKPKQSVTKEYQVKVTATADTTITNKACFIGNSAANDNAQQGCDVAVVKVTVPPKEETPTPTTTTTTTPETPTPTTAAPATQATALPSTGPTSTIIIGLLAMAAGYFARLKFLQRQAQNS
ncbi:MAG TPA: hypothetical protein VJ843_00820 [Candidatus Saccharimonadales bacterium]|nr:hypothetical protein [Candidatus Saccharimonadales bacterium]